jgi:hypothetical protein
MTKLKLKCCIFSLSQLLENKTEVHFKEFLLSGRLIDRERDRNPDLMGNSGQFRALG